MCGAVVAGVARLGIGTEDRDFAPSARDRDPAARLELDCGAAEGEFEGCGVLRVAH